MNVLILGGTGAMGVPLANILIASNDVWVTSRSERKSTHPNLHYIKGNAKQKEFLCNVLKYQRWDTVVDFMVRSEQQLKEILFDVLEATDQYVFISSARVYAECDGLITEDSPRLLEACMDKEYLKTNEYGLAKAREEDVLHHSGRNNWTIIRPSITYNDYRLQLGVMEKEDFVYRALHGRTIVFSHDLENKVTTMTHGNDVARGIAAIIGREEALGETYHITSPQSLTWGQVLDIYKKVLEEHSGHPISVKWTDLTTNFKISHQFYRIKYCRYFNRSFNNSKIGQFIDVNTFVAPEEGLAQCLRNFLASPKFGYKNWTLEGVNDRVTGEKTPIKEIQRTTDKLWYLAYRYDLGLMIRLMKKMVKMKQ